MRAVICRATEGIAALRLEERPPPEPGPGEVVIAVRAAGVNYPDLLVVSGRYQNAPAVPFIPGKDVAGIVAAVGPGVTAPIPGERVLAAVEHGAFAEFALAQAAHCTPLPPELGFADAAALGLVYQTAFFALIDRAQYQTGETVLVTGAAGGVGMAAVQLAKALGATVLAGVSRPARAAAARASGADHIIDLGRPNLREAVREAVRTALGGRLVDVVLDPVGGDVFDAALRALAWRGRLVTIGFAGGRIPEVKANYLLVKNIAVAGLQWSDYRDRAPDEMRRVQAEIFALHAAGRLVPQVAALPFTRFAEAMTRLEAGVVAGKIVLTFGPAAAL